MPVDTSALEAGLRRKAVEWAGQIGDGFVDYAKAGVSRRTGATADSIEHDAPVENGDSVTVRCVCNEPSGQYQDEGTGIYGPTGQRIEGNPLLAFDWPAAGGLVIVHSVAGSPGTHFWSNTIDAFPQIVAGV